MKNIALFRARHLRLGRRGESAAVRMLECHGLETISRNIPMRNGELDIVARDGGTFVFVEVKTRFLRKNADPGGISPHTNLRTGQKKRIRRAALEYLREVSAEEAVYRFDIVEVVFSRFGLYLMRHTKNAFGAGDYGRGTVGKINYF